VLGCRSELTSNNRQLQVFILICAPKRGGVARLSNSAIWVAVGAIGSLLGGVAAFLSVVRPAAAPATLQTSPATDSDLNPKQEQFGDTASGTRAQLTTAPDGTPVMATTPRAIRLQAVDCLDKGREALATYDAVQAQTQFACAERKFRTAAAGGDSYSWFGLSLIYGDPAIRPYATLEPGLRPDQSAAKYWCLAKQAGVPQTHGEPRFDFNPDC